jgi:glycosyltransferase involved in cell wall biosynthesis
VRVVYVVSVPGAGPVTHLLALAPKVAAAGFDVGVICADDALADAFRNTGVEADAAPLRHKLDFQGLARLRPLLRDAEIVHTHDRRAGLLARPLARVAGARIVHTYHGLPHQIAHRVGRPNAPLEPGVSRARAWWLLHGYLRIEALLSRLGLVVVPSRAVADFLVSRGLDRRRLRVVPNGIDVRRREPAPAREPLVVGTAGILEHRKGMDTLIEACARAAKPVQLEVFGDGSLRSALEDQAARFDVAAVFHGAVADVRDRLPDLDVFVLPSRDENLPMALLEAMAAALPVIATRVGGVPELVEDGRSGLLIEPDAPEELARAIDALAADEETRARLARAAAQRVADRFSDEAMAGGIVAVYEELVKGGRR